VRAKTPSPVYSATLTELRLEGFTWFPGTAILARVVLLAHVHTLYEAVAVGGLPAFVGACLGGGGTYIGSDEEDRGEKVLTGATLGGIAGLIFGVATAASPVVGS
jgi:hypothetical protein